MKKALGIFMLSMAASFSAKAQSDTSFQFIKTIHGDIADFAVDNLDNIYILSSRNQVKKLDAKGDSVAVFNDVRRFGNATLIDVSNPMKILLYYKDFSTIVMLGRFLNVLGAVDLRNQNIFQVKAVGLSFDNNIWIYDEEENKLKKIDGDGKVLLGTPDFRLLFGEAPTPQSIFDEDKYVYLYDSAQAVFVFDYYGTLKNKILISGWQNFKVAGKYIFGTSNNTLHRYEIRNFRLDEWKLPEQLSQSLSFHFTSGYLYVLKKDEINIYSLK